MNTLKKTLIYDRKWVIHPDYPDFAFAENGDVADITEAPPLILERHISEFGQAKTPYVYVTVRNKKDEPRTIVVANELVYLYGLKSKENKDYYWTRYKDGNFKNIDISNLEVYKRRSDLKVLSESHEKEIASLLKGKQHSRRQLAQMYKCTEMTIRKIAIKYLDEKPKGIRLELKQRPEDKSMNNLIRQFDCRISDKYHKKNKLFTMRKVNDVLSNYLIKGMVGGVNMKKVAHGSYDGIRKQVLQLNEHFFGVKSC